jgi:hypothetical protein
MQVGYYCKKCCPACNGGNQKPGKTPSSWPEELMTADFEIAPVLPFTLTSVRSVFALPLDAVA